jgi:hypothetical protein
MHSQQLTRAYLAQTPSSRYSSCKASLGPSSVEADCFRLPLGIQRHFDSPQFRAPAESPNLFVQPRACKFCPAGARGRGSLPVLNMGPECEIGVLLAESSYLEMGAVCKRHLCRAGKPLSRQAGAAIQSAFYDTTRLCYTAWSFVGQFCGECQDFCTRWPIRQTLLLTFCC